MCTLREAATIRQAPYGNVQAQSIEAIFSPALQSTCARFPKARSPPSRSRIALAVAGILVSFSPDGFSCLNRAQNVSNRFSVRD
jgi:hypothetical protein